MSEDPNFIEFHVDYNIETPKVIDEKILDEVEFRLRALRGDRTDIVGAAVSLEDIAGVERSYLYQARIVVYMRPKQIASVAKNEHPRFALKDALTDLERKVGDYRTRLKETWQRTDIQTEMNVFDLTAEEVFKTYLDVEEEDPEELILEGRDKIASRLMANERLDQETAYYAADRILDYSFELTENN